MKKILGIIASLSIIAGLMSGCATKPAGNTSNTPSQVPTTTPEITQTIEQEQENNEEISAFPITYTDALGREVVIEKEPQRIVSLMHVLYPDVLLSLGITPIGVASADTQHNIWEAYKSYTDVTKSEDIGAPRGINFEKVLSLEPDLILAAAGGIHDDLLEQLEAITTVVYIDQRKASTDRAYGVREISKVLGMEAEGEAVLERVNQKIADGREKLKDFAAKGETVVFSSLGDKVSWLYGKNIAPTNEENGLGLKLPDNYPSDTTASIGVEGMAELNPDHLFILVDKATFKESDLSTYTDNSVWNSISAVKNGNVHILDLSAFAQDAPIATEYGVDVVVDILTKDN
jgi:iron complex transport system substrate-binding protein